MENETIVLEQLMPCLSLHGVTMSVLRVDFVEVKVKHEWAIGDFTGNTNAMVIHYADDQYWENEDVRAMVFAEDPSDGYRSMLGGYKQINAANKTYPMNEYGEWVFIQTESRSMLVFMTDRGVLLEAGTINSDDYYPVCIMRVNPKNGEV